MITYPRDRPPPGRDLTELISLRIVLQAECLACRHRKLLYPAELIDRLGANCPVLAVQMLLKCGVCGSRRTVLHELTR